MVERSRKKYPETHDGGPDSPDKKQRGFTQASCLRRLSRYARVQLNAPPSSHPAHARSTASC